RVALSTGNNLYADVEDNRLLFTFGPESGSGGPFPPTGHYLLFQDLSPGAPPITGITFLTNLDGFDASFLSFTPHSIKVGEGGINYSGGQFLTINAQFIPEPSVLFLSGIVFPAIALQRRR